MELPESVPKRPFVIAVALVLLGFLAILFASGSALIIWMGAFSLLVGGAIGTKLGLDLWKATE